MAVVAPDPPHAALLVKAAGAGRIRGIGTDIWRRIRAEPRRAGALLRLSLREARALHSRERRLVADVLYDLVRHEAVFQRLLGTDAPEALWLAALLLLGLPEIPSDAPELDPRARAALASGLAEARRQATAGLTDAARLAVIAGVPEEVAAELLRAYDAAAERFVDASNARAPVSLRAVGDPDALVARLASEGIEAVRSNAAPQAVRVVGRANLTALASFREGHFEVQDEGSQLLAALVQPTGQVVDLCAGAGGKALAMAAIGADVLALDVRRRALDELRKRARRAGAQIRVRALDDDALPPDVAAIRADRVLVDAPCSGTGTWRRHPELRWRLDPARLAELGALQRRLLDRAARLVRVGGRLIYGTCSVLPLENEDVVDDFLRDHPGFRLIPASDVLADAGQFLRTAPHTHDTDGFFGAVMERTSGG